MRLRKNYVPWAISVIALVFAMAGGAYAAKKYVITSTNQIKPSVLKSLQGKAGAVGPQGVAGANGKDGASGAQGGSGEQGKQGVQGVQGVQGDPGDPGEPWVAGGTLPPGATLTGTWFPSPGLGVEGFLGINPGVSQLAISFPIPLTNAPDVVIVKSEENKSAQGCEGLVEGRPTAAEGTLCIYQAGSQGAGQNVDVEVLNPLDSSPTVAGAAPMGAIIQLNCLSPNGCGAAGNGVWAVTGE